MRHKNKLLVASCTKGLATNTPLHASLSHIQSEHDIYSISDIWSENNTNSISGEYNKILNEYSDDYEYILLCHDDVFINCVDFVDRLDRSPYDVTGLAGATSITIKEPTLWHLMSDRKHHVGAVSHPCNDTQYIVSSFGPLPSRALVIDGLFICIRTSAKTSELRFDESNPGMWHLYDMDFCLTCNENKVTIGVVDIPVIHNSPGLRSLNDEAFKLSQKWFIDKWMSKAK